LIFKPPEIIPAAFFISKNEIIKEKNIYIYAVYIVPVPCFNEIYKSLKTLL